MAVSGAILTGGSSTRMGIDKALIAVGGFALAEIVAQALIGAGVDEVLTIGGNRSELSQLDGISRSIVDDFPNEGPLGGIISSLRYATSDLVVVLACDTPAITSETPRRLLEAIEASPESAAVVAEVAGRIQPLTAVWRKSLALAELERVFETGERAPRMVLDQLPTLRLTNIEPSGVDDVDSPADLRRYDARASSPPTANEGTR